MRTMKFFKVRYRIVNRYIREWIGNLMGCENKFYKNIKNTIVHYTIVCYTQYHNEEGYKWLLCYTQ